VCGDQARHGEQDANHAGPPSFQGAVNLGMTAGARYTVAG
jgi:hypothetical protein